MARISCILASSLILGHALLAQTVPGSDVSSTQPDERSVTWKQLIPNIVNDQKQIWTFPVRAFQTKAWIPLIGVLSVTAGLVAADPLDTPYFKRTSTFHGFNSVLT